MGRLVDVYETFSGFEGYDDEPTEWELKLKGVQTFYILTLTIF